MTSARKFVTLLCAAACCGPAFADVDGKAQLGGLGYMLADLDAADGIAPALTLIPDPWGPPAGSVYLTYSQLSRGGSPIVDFSDFRSSPDSNPLALDYRWQGFYGSGTLDGRADPLGQRASVEAQLPVGLDWRTTSQDVDADRIAFTITPHTAVTFYATLAATGSATPDGSNSFSAFGMLTLEIEQPQGWWGRDTGSATLEANQYYPALDDTAILLASLANPADAEALGSVDMTLAGRAATAAPIPEPAAAFMFGAGTLLVIMRRYKDAGRRLTMFFR